MKKFTPILMQTPLLLLLVVLIVTFIPFLGESLFHTKGEPREAVVALSMLQSGDWILPVSNGGDIPYKPPMLAWLIACLGWLNGGVVTEFISRFPSAVAAIVMIMWGYVVAKRQLGTRTALFMALITATSFEVHRAATNCRVDMLLTMFIVCGIYAMYSAFNRRESIFSWVAVLMLSGAVLTKGPVGVILPLLVMWIFSIWRSRRFIRPTLDSAAMALLALIIPALWYYAAYQRGGDLFLQLVMEENFGRFTGTMSYESHVNPWWYNILTILAGMAPYTLLVLILAIPMVIRRNRSLTLRRRLSVIAASSWRQLMLVSALTIFVFYCIPASKRSVYLLPMYPMMAWFVADVAERALDKAAWTVRAYGWIIAVAGILIPALFFVVRYSGFSIGGSNAMFVESIRRAPLGFAACLTIGLSLILSWRIICYAVKGASSVEWWYTIMATVALYWSFSALYQPAVLNIKSQKPVAMALMADGYGTVKQIDGWMEDPLSRHYIVDFYMHDRLTHRKSVRDSVPVLLLRGEFPVLQRLTAKRLDFTLLKEFRDPSGKERKDLILVMPTDKRKRMIAERERINALPKIEGLEISTDNGNVTVKGQLPHKNDKIALKKSIEKYEGENLE